jgi:hypothetical protein
MDMNTLNTGRPADEAQRIITEYLTSEGLEYPDERGEMVWRKGTGALTSPQFIKTEILPDGTMHIEAWIAGAALMPGVYGGELDGAPVAYTPPAAAVPAGWHADPVGRHEQRYWDGTRWTGDVADGGTASVDAEGIA